jgi:hypothetical protein
MIVSVGAAPRTARMVTPFKTRMVSLLILNRRFVGFTSISFWFGLFLLSPKGESPPNNFTDE